MPDGLSQVTDIAAGGKHSIALKSDGTLVAWGSNKYGQCEIPNGLRNVSQIAAGMSHTIVLAPIGDCNLSGQRDSYEIGRGWMPDSDRDGRIDACEVALGDLDLNGEVDAADISLLLLDFGPCDACAEDLDADGFISMGDLSLLLMNFGPIG